MPTTPIHSFDRKKATVSANAFRAEVEGLLPGAEKAPDALGFGLMSARELVGFSWGLDRDAAATAKYLHTLARLTAVLFSVERTGGGPIELSVMGKMRRFEGKVDRSRINIGRWLEGMWAAMAVRDPVSALLLSYTPRAKLESSSKGDPFMYDLADALRASWFQDPEADAHLLRALKSTAPAQVSINPMDWVLDLYVPVIDALHRVFANEPQALETALSKGIDLHAEYWKRENTRDAKALLSLPLLAVASTAAARGMAPGTESDYVPEELWALSGPLPQLILCPYCTSPVDEEATWCPGCTRNVRGDAPLEMSFDSWRKAPRKEHGPHAVPVLSLAVGGPLIAQ